MSGDATSTDSIEESQNKIIIGAMTHLSYG